MIRGCIWGKEESIGDSLYRKVSIMKSKKWTIGICIVILYISFFFKPEIPCAAISNEVFVRDQYGRVWEPGKAICVAFFFQGEEETTARGQPPYERLLSPGSYGSYRFSIHNESSYDINYQITGEMSGEKRVPIEFQFSTVENQQSKKIEWHSWNEVFSAIQKENLLSGEQVEVELRWRWTFERELDEEDTQMGNDAVLNDLIQQLAIKIVVEESHRNKTSDRDAKRFPETGSRAIFSTSPIGLGLVILFFLGYRKRKAST